MGVENGMFRSEIGSGFEDPGGTPPPRIPRSTLPPGFPLPSSFSFFRSYFHDQCALRAVPVYSPQSLSTINISY